MLHQLISKACAQIYNVFKVYYSILIIISIYIIWMDIQKQDNKKKHVQWDQQKLQQTEKDRGKYEKIIQPKTPYRRNSDDSLEQMDVETIKTSQQLQIENSLKTASINRQANKRSKIDLTALNAQLKQQMAKYHQPQQMDEEQNEQQKNKKQQFRKKRAQHYNQFKAVMQAKKNDWQDDSDQP